MSQLYTSVSGILDGSNGVYGIDSVALTICGGNLTNEFGEHVTPDAGHKIRGHGRYDCENAFLINGLLIPNRLFTAALKRLSAK